MRRRHAVERGGVRSVDEQDSVQVVDLVLEDAGQVALATIRFLLKRATLMK